MPMSPWRLALALALSAALGWPSAQAARKSDPNKLPSIRVQDLHYGEVLFQFYAGQEFQALTELEAFSQWQRMPHHAACLLYTSADRNVAELHHVHGHSVR